MDVRRGDRVLDGGASKWAARAGSDLQRYRHREHGDAASDLSPAAATNARLVGIPVHFDGDHVGGAQLLSLSE